MNNKIKEETYKKLSGMIEKKCILLDEPMSKHTTFRIGGNADIFIEVGTIEDVQMVVELCKVEGIPYYILGNGSNLLVGDKGYRGVVIQIYKGLGQVVVKGEVIHAQAGALLSRIAREAIANELEGFEFAAGIPGSLGGAIVMNAGAYGGEMKDVLTSVTVLDSCGDIKELSMEELELGYRTSVLEKKGYIALAATISLKKGDKEAIQARMDELKEQRVTKQPLEFPSAGSTFKRPEGYFAAKLIDDTGLRGLRVGDAQVSEKHCGFVINRGKATACDVIELMEQVGEKVYQKYGIVLEPEIKKIGEF